MSNLTLGTSFYNIVDVFFPCCLHEANYNEPIAQMMIERKKKKLELQDLKLMN